MGYYEERIKQEIKTMKAKRAFALQAKDYDAFRSLIDELCAFTVKQFFDVDSKRKMPYSEATTNRRKEYIKELYASFSATTGYNPPLVFEKRAASSLGAYSSSGNLITLNELLLDEDDPRKTIRTLLHEARHAFQHFAVEHPWRAKPDESNLYSWEFNIENYIRSDVDFNMYRS